MKIDWGIVIGVVLGVAEVVLGVAVVIGVVLGVAEVVLAPLLAALLGVAAVIAVAVLRIYLDFRDGRTSTQGNGSLEK